MGLKNVNFDDMDQMVPVALMLIAMPISSSIGHAIGLGLISYTVIKVFTGKFKDVSVLTYGRSRRRSGRSARCGRRPPRRRRTPQRW